MFTILCRAPRATGERILAAALIFCLITTQDIQRSHIDENVPAQSDFNKLMRRDLATHFARVRKEKIAQVEYELLRDGPTQSGPSYPKFYAWVLVAGGKSPHDRGAVRLSAIDKRRFDVTDFVSEEMIRRDPDSIYQTFPAAVCEKIRAKLTR